MCTKLRLVSSFTILFLAFSGFAQSTYWEQATLALTPSAPSMQGLSTDEVAIFRLEEKSFRDALSSPSAQKGLRTTVFFPDGEGRVIPFSVIETPVFSPELADKFPDIKSYSGYSLEHGTDRIRFSISHNGMESMMVQADDSKVTFIQKTTSAGDVYMVYGRDDAINADMEFICLTKDNIRSSKLASPNRVVDDQTLRTYRIAVSASGEYTQFHGGAVADALAAINATLTRVNEVFERDLAVRLELVANNDEIIFTNAGNDPYTNNLNTQVQNTITNNIGEPNYDVGHLFHRDSDGGNAGFIGSVCNNNQKGSAYSAANNPIGDIYDLDFVAHELGHQFGANHSWSFESEGTLVQVEPASGSTIMGYAGIVQGNNVAPNGDDYFHYFSIFQIAEYLAATSCAAETALSNVPPVIIPQGDFIIPKGTPFVLDGSATDADPGDVLTYTWEQIDNGIVTSSSFGPDNPSGANFRSQRPGIADTRYFPKLSEIAQGNITQINPTVNSAWETVSNVERDLNFAFTVRDNAAGGGQVVSDLVSIQVLNNAGPFVVTSQEEVVSYMAGSNQTVSWDVANTNILPIDAQLVDLLLSVDGGDSFPVILAQDVLNDGEHDIQLPALPTSEGRIMVRASDNIFLAVNAADFTIAQSPFVLNFSSLTFDVCQPANLVIPFSYETTGGFNELVSFSSSGAPSGLGITFSPASAISDNTPVSLTLSNTDGVASGSYSIKVLATSDSMSREVDLTVNIYNSTFSEVPLTSPANGSVEISPNVTLEWVSSITTTSFDIQIARDAAFNNIIESAEVTTSSYNPVSLQPENLYYWRIRPKNQCGQGTFGPAFSFTTIVLNCQTANGNGLPLTISSTGTPTVTSTISVSNDLSISDVNVILDMDHSFLSDLEVSLSSPAGTRIILIANSCGDLQNIDVVFDDDAGVFTCGGNPGINGVMQPLGSLATFNGESTLGDWILEVSDNALEDGGRLNTFALEICAEGDYRPDDDGDGVFNDGDDLCPNTPPDTDVDTNGCPIYRFPSDNFTVSIQSESCAGSNDGSIEILAGLDFNYSLGVTSPISLNDAFTNSYQLDNLSAGSYAICITAIDGDREYEAYCFNAVVSEPEPLSVSSVISSDGLQATLSLSGSDSYTLILNGKVMKTRESTFELRLQPGMNSITVTTDLPCQGSFEDEIFVSGRPVLFPNPFSANTTVFLGMETSDVQVTVHDASGRLIWDGNYQPDGAELEIDFSEFPSGLYLVTLIHDGVRETFKAVKR